MARICHRLPCRHRACRNRRQTSCPECPGQRQPRPKAQTTLVLGPLRSRHPRSDDACAFSRRNIVTLVRASLTDLTAEKYFAGRCCELEKSLRAVVEEATAAHAREFVRCSALACRIRQSTSSGA